MGFWEWDHFLLEIRFVIVRKNGLVCGGWGGCAWEHREYTDAAKWSRKRRGWVWGGLFTGGIDPDCHLDKDERCDDPQQPRHGTNPGNRANSSAGVWSVRAIARLVFG